MSEDNMQGKQRLWRQYLQFVIAHPAWILLGVFALTCVLAFSARHLKVINNTELWLPHGDPYVEATHTIEEVFGAQDMVVVAITPVQGDVYQPAVLEKIARLQEKIRQIPEAVKNNVVSFAGRKVKAIHGAREGMEVRPMLATIPQTPQELAQLKRAVAENPFYIGALVSPDGRFAAVVAEFKLKKDAIGFTDLNHAIRAAVESERDATVNLYVAGSPISFAAIEHYTATAGAYFAAAFLIIMLVQYLSFRSIQGMLVPMVTATLSVLWGLGVLGLCGYDLDVLNTTTPILIMAITSGHAIQLLKRYYEEYDRLSAAAAHEAVHAPPGLSGLTAVQISKQAVVDSLMQVGSVMLAAGVIAALTFYSLSFAKIDMVQHFGLFAGSGVLAGLILEITFVPALRSILRPPIWRAQRAEAVTAAVPSVLDRLLKLLSHQIASQRAPWILIATVAVVALLGAGITQLKVDDSTLRYLAPSHPVRSDDKVINSAFGGTNTIYFLVESAQRDRMKDPQVLLAMEQLQVFLERQTDVGKTQSLADLVKRMNQAVHADDPAYYTVPKDQATIAQYLFLYSLSGDPQDFDNYVDNDYTKSMVWTYVKNDSTAYFEDLVKKVQPLLEQFPPGVTVRIGGTLAEIYAVNESVVNEKIINTAQMALVIFVLTSLMLRSFVGGLFVVIPVVIIVVANFGIMGWLGIPLDMGTATTASMAIGIGADYEIYLLYRFREELARCQNIRLATERSLQTSGKAILFIAMALAGGYSVLFLSDFAFYARLSTAVIMTMIVSALSAIVLVRAMILVFQPRFIFGNTFDDQASVQSLESPVTVAPMPATKKG